MFDFNTKKLHLFHLRGKSSRRNNYNGKGLILYILQQDVFDSLSRASHSLLTFSNYFSQSVNSKFNAQIKKLDVFSVSLEALKKVNENIASVLLRISMTA